MQPLLRMKTYDEAVAVSKKAGDHFFLYAFMLRGRISTPSCLRSLPPCLVSKDVAASVSDPTRYAADQQSKTQNPTSIDLPAGKVR
ncbi:MAG TPA: hypothetical protein VNZ64_09400 [Candidatus Acidoferrum sp.]|nr:hypothetical protein [Candidatus Acidoferrum sp.]